MHRDSHGAKHGESTLLKVGKVQAVRYMMGELCNLLFVYDSHLNCMPTSSLKVK